MTRKERFEYLVKEVSEVKQELRTANTEESVNTALDKLSTLMDRLSKDSQVTDVKGWVANISGTIRGVKLHDVTRSALDDMLEKLLKMAMEIIRGGEERKRTQTSSRLCFWSWRSTPTKSLRSSTSTRFCADKPKKVHTF